MELQHIQSKKVYIFDVDGTLYAQRKLQIRMALYLLCHYLTHLSKLRELVALYTFRKLREEESCRGMTLTEQIDLACQKTGLDRERGQKAIRDWMFQKPLESVRACAFSAVLDFIRREKAAGKRVVIYSDYPAEEKLAVLGVTADFIFTPQMPEIGELKPSRRAMDHICAVLDCPTEDILYVGDRDCKDGESARMVGIDYCDIRQLCSLLRG